MPNKKLILVILLALVLPLLVLAARQIQDTRKRAAGSNEVGMRFSPASGTFTAGEQVRVKVVMHKLATRTINVSGVQAVLNVSDKFNIDSVQCEAPFNALPFVRINGQSVTLMCAIASVANPVAVTSADLPFASLNLTVADAAVDGPAPIAFSSTRATEAGIAGQAPDVSTAGTTGDYNIGGGGISPTLPDGVTVTPPVTGDVVLSFSPGTVVVPPSKPVKIMAQVGSNNIAFTRTVITFDQAKINLGSEISTNPNLSTIVEKTSMATANSQGKAIIVVATAPTDSKPTGSFELASFTLSGISTQANDTASINFETTDMQFVEGAGQQLTIGVIPLGVTVNGQDISITPPTGNDFEVPIGTKDVINVDIAQGPTPTGAQPTDVPGNIPQITFSAVLSHSQNNPDLYFRLRVKDELFFLDNPNIILSPSCNVPSAGDKDYYIPMRAVGTIYKPVSSIGIPPPSGVNVANVTADGWVILDGVNENRYYSLILKAPKFRGSQMVDHVFLRGGQRTDQIYSWVNNPLEPGDLPNPNNQMLQDCTVNSIDISLMIARIGNTGTNEIEVADVNFDGIVNGNDISKVVNTLSTKPDDDL
ncbi:hypothetical protein A2W14_02730 [Candidatus Gottesmanbacteria bacterium RBG_16_37_8]|uniref:Dockerin domain-containing protein n=1 Tax=Candidatus Gottesmanbacteria bacterium RBG_16_37_8 TaxID=1798371 RepID=A0A1F5YPU8_9BACT|nr:MAG: hypothetical protein A2W14_02730 [Candidatus Gottesmanbacteria bacterium RBG_16_37_8]